MTARPLGPHPLLAAAAAMRLRAAGAQRGDAVVMVVAGSTDPDAAVDTYVAGRLLQARWGGAGPGRAPERGGALRRGRDGEPAPRRARAIAMSPYLLAPGHFAAKARTISCAAPPRSPTCSGSTRWWPSW